MRDLDLYSSKILAFQINSRHKRGIIKEKTNKKEAEEDDVDEEVKVEEEDEVDEKDK